MADQFLIDTSTAIKYLNQTLPSKSINFIDGFINEHCILSFISKIELLAWEPPNPSDLAIYQQFVDSSKVIGINSSIIDETIAIRKQFRLKMPDAIIAATAIVYKLTLLGDNDKDFGKVANLSYSNPRHI